jgi:hypothetical protein
VVKDGADELPNRDEIVYIPVSSTGVTLLATALLVTVRTRGRSERRLNGLKLNSMAVDIVYVVTLLHELECVPRL